MSSMMGSSKYEFEPELFEKDYNSKVEIATKFKNDLIKVICRDYKYHDNSKMTKEWKRKIITDVYLQFIGVDKD